MSAPDVIPCPHCGSTGPNRCACVGLVVGRPTIADRIARAAGYPADRIAQLEAELTEAREKLCEATASNTTEALADQRDCAYEALASERAAHTATQAKLADVEARLLAAQGEAVAMREALKGAKQWMFTHCDPDSENGRAYRRDKQAVVNALTGDAGHAIAERVPLWRDLETANRIESLNEHPHACPCARCVVLRKLAAIDEKPEPKENT